MQDPDFSGIDPLRIPEARRRVAAIVEYLKTANRTNADADAFAARVGISRFQFHRLVRVWRDHRDTRLLVVGKRGVATRDYGIDARAAAITEEVISAAGANAELREVAPEIEQRCAAEGLSAPSKPTIWNRLRKLRADGHASFGPPRILIGRMWFHLPVLHRPADAMPALLVAVLMPERHILEYQVSLDPADPPSVGALLTALAARRSPGSCGRRLIIEPDDRRAAAPVLEQAGLGRVRSHNRSVQREMARAFGGRLGPLAALYRRSSARPETKRVLLRQDEALPAGQVIGVVVQAVADHNAAAHGAAPEFDIVNG